MLAAWVKKTTVLRKPAVLHTFLSASISYQFNHCLLKCTFFFTNTYIKLKDISLDSQSTISTHTVNHFYRKMLKYAHFLQPDARNIRVPVGLGLYWTVQYKKI